MKPQFILGGLFIGCRRNDGDHFQLSSGAANAADNEGLHHACGIV